jgi:hypothetical protein
MIELGREICVNLEHPEKQSLPSEVIESWREIDSILKFWKLPLSNEQMIGWIKMILVSGFNNDN